MSRRKVLPLVGSNWLPLQAAFDRFRQRLGDETLAQKDLNAAFRRGNVRTKMRTPDGHQDGTLLPPGFWEDCKFADWGDSTRRMGAGVERGVYVQDRHGVHVRAWIYVWEPDFKKICGGEVAPAAETEEASKPPAKMGPPAIFDWVEITAEIAYRCYLKGERPRPRKRGDFAETIAKWCEPRFGKAPDHKNILKAIAAVMRRLD